MYTDFSLQNGIARVSKRQFIFAIMATFFGLRFIAGEPKQRLAKREAGLSAESQLKLGLGLCYLAGLDRRQQKRLLATIKGLDRYDLAHRIVLDVQNNNMVVLDGWIVPKSEAESWAVMSMAA